MNCMFKNNIRYMYDYKQINKDNPDCNSISKIFKSFFKLIMIKHSM